MGASTAQGANDMKLRALEIIKPQSGVGGVTPNPRNDSELNASNIHDQRMAPWSNLRPVPEEEDEKDSK